MKTQVIVCGAGPTGLALAAMLAKAGVRARIFEKNAARFIAGDAAHIHSPAGGQGMNTGIQDALNLGDKLGRVLARGADPSLLDRYEAERLPVARGVVRGTDFFFKLALQRESALAGLLRRTILPRVISLRGLQRRVVRSVSQVDVARREIASRRA